MNTTDAVGNDGIYISVQCPSLQSGENLIVEFCQPELYRGIDYVPIRNRYIENAETTVYDSSGYGHDGIINHPDDVKFVESEVEGSYCLDVQSANFTVQTDKIFYDNTNQCHTINFWYKKNEDVVQKIINFNLSYYTRYTNTSTRSLMYINSGTTNDHYVYGSTIPLNEWTMVTWLYDHNEGICKVYYNGVLNATASWTPAQIAARSPYGFTTPTQLFQLYGQIDDFRIYGTILNDEDIKSLYEVKGHIDKIGNVKSGNFEEKNIGDELLTSQKLGWGQHSSYTTEASIEYITNGTQVINKITFGETNTSWKILTSTAFDKNIILGKKLLWSFSWKTDTQFNKSLVAQFRQSNGLNPITMTPQTSYNQGDWVRYTGIMTMGDTYIGNQGLYIAVGDGRYTNNILYIKDLSLKIIDDTDDDKLAEVTKKSQVIANEIVELQTEKAMINKYSRLIANEIIEI